jgi:Na+-transporting NADH:ubiquinone oxidoreductase subunit A
MDSSPHAPDVDLIIAEKQEAFDTGLKALSTLTEGPTFLCVKEGSSVSKALTAKVQVEHFAGPHPSGTPGFHVHTLMPAHRQRVVWTITYHEVIAIGELFMTGHLSAERVVSIAGPAAREPRLVRTRPGASLKEMMEGELNTEAEVRIISGDVLSGMAANDDAFYFLGKRAAQVSALREAGERTFLGWLGWGENLFSVIPTFLSSIMGKKSFDLTTDTNGSPRAMVPIGMYEKVTALDLVPTHLLRALLVGDVEMAEKLGALELDEEDVALYSFVCPGKTNYGNILRANLERMFAEG